MVDVTWYSCNRSLCVQLEQVRVGTADCGGYECV